MAREDFDNILHSLEASILFNAGNFVSLEMDFEIPRGFIVKIKTVQLRVDRIGEDLESINADMRLDYQLALIKDPDDTTTVSMTSNRVEHDVIVDLEVMLNVERGTAESAIIIVPSTARIIKDFAKEGIDMFTARNMRLNLVALGTDAALASEAFGVAQVDYTLEKIKDEDLLDILGVL